jgi:hypothetical protein
MLSHKDLGVRYTTPPLQLLSRAVNDAKSCPLSHHSADDTIKHCERDRRRGKGEVAPLSVLN